MYLLIYHNFGNSNVIFMMICKNFIQFNSKHQSEELKEKMSYKNLIDILSYENEVFRTYVFWSAILVVKMLALSMLTGMKRHKNKVKKIINESQHDSTKTKM